MLVELQWDHLSRVWQFGQLRGHKAIGMGSGSTAPVPEQDDILDFEYVWHFWSGVHSFWNVLQLLWNVITALKVMKHYKFIHKHSKVTWGEGHWYWPDGSCKRIGHAWVGQDTDCTGEAAPRESNVHPLKDRKNGHIRKSNSSYICNDENNWRRRRCFLLSL